MSFRPFLYCYLFLMLASTNAEECTCRDRATKVLTWDNQYVISNFQEVYAEEYVNLDSFAIAEPLLIKYACFLDRLKFGDDKTFYQKVHVLRSDFPDVLDLSALIFKDSLVIGKNICYGKIDLSRAKIDSTFYIKGISLSAEQRFIVTSAEFKGSIVIKGIELNKELNLSDALFLKPPHRLWMKNVDVSQINIDYSYFKLDTTSLMIHEIEYTYQALLKSQLNFGYLDGYKKIDIEYQKYTNLKNYKYGALLNGFHRVWWNFGYDKSNVIWCTLILALFFSVISFPSFPKFIEEVYTIDFLFDQFSERAKKGNITTRLYFNTLYTCMIFFGLKIELSKLKFHDFRTLYLLLIYLSGLICVGFIVHYIIWP